VVWGWQTMMTRVVMIVMTRACDALRSRQSHPVRSSHISSHVAESYIL
jgi:hypothetical protein